MTLTRLITLIALVDTGSFTEAAKRCKTTQPTITNNINRLEAEMGVTILQRAPGRLGLELTPIGQVIAAQARVIVKECALLEEAVSAFRKGKPLPDRVPLVTKSKELKAAAKKAVSGVDEAVATLRGLEAALSETRRQVEAIARQG